jgi:hypothetical protein
MFVITYTNAINIFIIHVWWILFLLYLSYKSESRGFDFLFCHLYFLLTYYFWPHYEPGIEPVSNRNEYQEYFLLDEGSQWVWPTISPPSRAYFLDNWGPQHPGILRDSPGLCREIALFSTPGVTRSWMLNFAARFDELNDIFGHISFKTEIIQQY